MAFTTTLPRAQKALFWESIGPDQSKGVAKLQEAFDAGKVEVYNRLKQTFEAAGRKVRLTKGRVFQIEDKGRVGTVNIKFQVKGGSITWYIDAPMDETHQSFRDEVYRSAAIAHLTVDNHCERYYRGTNSLHVKKMHTHESESALNHNHYRVRDGHDVDPKDVKQHLEGFVFAQRKLGLINPNTNQEKFLTEKEARHIITAFKIHSIMVNHLGPEKTVEVDGKTIALPRRLEKSILQEYKDHPSEKFTKEDEEEWAKYKHEEQPCRSIDTGLIDRMEMAQLELKLQSAMRGIGSERANTRQVAGSAHKAIKTVVAMDDRKFDVPKVDLEGSIEVNAGGSITNEGGAFNGADLVEGNGSTKVDRVGV